MQMRGTVRFRFRSPENNIDIIIEGESNVVESLRQNWAFKEELVSSNLFPLD